jgi:hypothetical protein
MKNGSKMKFTIDTEKPDGWHDDFCSGCKSSSVKIQCSAVDCYASFCSGCKKKCGTEMYGCFFICTMCAKGTQGFGDDFLKNEKNITYTKQCIRNDFCSVISNSMNILMLDCGETSECIFDNFRPRGVWVPNPSAEITEKLRNMGVFGFQQRLGYFLTQKYTVYDAAWFDYCSTYDGSNTGGFYPRHDLRKMWEYGFNKESKKVHLAVTFCKRGCSTSMDGMIQEQIETAKLNGWKAKVKHVIEYGQMYYVRFEAKIIC